MISCCNDYKIFLWKGEDFPLMPYLFHSNGETKRENLLTPLEKPYRYRILILLSPLSLSHSTRFTHTSRSTRNSRPNQAVLTTYHKSTSSLDIPQRNKALAKRHLILVLKRLNKFGLVRHHNDTFENMLQIMNTLNHILSPLHIQASTQCASPPA